MFNYNIGQETIHVFERYKDLGCILTESLDYNSTANTLAESAGRALGGILNKARSIDGLSFNIYTKLFNASVMPIMYFSAAEWGYKLYIQNVIQYKIK